MSMLYLCPAPRSLTVGEGVFYLQNGACVLLDDRSLWSSIRLAARRNPLTKSLHYAVSSSATTPSVTFFREPELGHEAYTLTVTEDCIVITYGDGAGAFYGMTTLVQIVENCGAAIPCYAFSGEKF